MIPSGKNNVTFGILINDDNIREESETFNLTIDGSSLPNSVTSRDNATVTIVDNDSKWLIFSLGPRVIISVYVNTSYT